MAGRGGAEESRERVVAWRGVGVRACTIATEESRIVLRAHQIA